jgi:mRNA interferase RelE/StbE
VKFTYSKRAAAELAALPRAQQQRIAKKMRFFTAQEDPLTFASPLTGFSAYRFRIGDYRVIFEIERETLFVLAIRKRDRAYQGLE